MLYAVREGISEKKVGKLETRKKIKSIWPSKDFTTNGIELNLMESAEAEKWKIFNFLEFQQNAVAISC